MFKSALFFMMVAASSSIAAGLDVLESEAFPQEPQDIVQTKVITIDPTRTYLSQAGPCLGAKLSPGDFGLSEKRAGGVVDVNLQNFLDKASTAGMSVNDMGGDDLGLRAHIQCLLDNSAKMAEASLAFGEMTKGKIFEEKDVIAESKKGFAAVGAISHPKISKIYARASKLAENEPCRFLKSAEKIQCGALEYSFKGNAIVLDGRTIVSAANRFMIPLSVQVVVYDHQKEKIVE